MRKDKAKSVRGRRKGNQAEVVNGSELGRKWIMRKDWQRPELVDSDRSEKDVCKGRAVSHGSGEATDRSKGAAHSRGRLGPSHPA